MGLSCKFSRTSLTFDPEVFSVSGLGSLSDSESDDEDRLALVGRERLPYFLVPTMHLGETSLPGDKGILLLEVSTSCESFVVSSIGHREIAIKVKEFIKEGPR